MTVDTHEGVDWDAPSAAFSHPLYPDVSEDNASGPSIPQDMVLVSRSEYEALKRRSEILKDVNTHLPGTIFTVVHQEGRYHLKSVSEGVRGLLGISAAELLAHGDNALDRVIARDRSEVIKALDSSAEDLSPWTIEFRVENSSGEPRWVWAAAMPKQGIQGTIEWTGLIIDIHDRQRAVENQKLYRECLSQSVDGVMIVDARQSNKPIIYVNDAFETTTGYSKKEVIGRHAGLLQGSDTSPQTISKIRQSLQEAQPCQAIIKNYRKNGTVFWNQLTISPIFNDEEHLTHFVGIISDITGRRRVEENLQLSDAVLQQLPTGVVLLNEKGVIYRWLGAAEAILGYPASKTIGTRFSDLLPRELKHHWPLHGGSEDPPRQKFCGEFELKKDDGSKAQVEISSQPLIGLGSCGETNCSYLVMIKDISQRRALEGQLHLSQKLEALGQLSGGIAHDFNNLLTALWSHSGELDELLEDDHPGKAELQEIDKTIKRATSLTRHLLSFARRDVVEPSNICFKTLLKEVRSLLKRVLGEDIQLESRLEDTLWPLRADRGQVEQVLVNLAVNARDAMMPKGGVLNVSAENYYLTEEHIPPGANLASGEYIRIGVDDNGCGMPETVRDRIFEPFFTTKAPGKGTGLGLATCFGIIRQLGGHISCTSSENVGTAFTILLPRGALPKRRPVRPRAITPVPRGVEQVLMVEDEESIRRISASSLKGHGYQVLQAACAKEASKLIKEHAGNISLLITDVVLPGGSGTDNAAIYQKLNPRGKVLYISGYERDALVLRGINKADAPMLEKPFDTKRLLMKVRQTLDS